jgi:hypothetical protein
MVLRQGAELAALAGLQIRFGFLGWRGIEPRGAARCEQSLKVRASVQAGAVADGLAPRDVLHEMLHAGLRALS